MNCITNGSGLVVQGLLLVHGSWLMIMILKWIFDRVVSLLGLLILCPEEMLG